MIKSMEEVFEWADGVKSAVYTPDQAHKVSDEEAILAGMILAIKQQMPEFKEDLKREYSGEEAHKEVFNDLKVLEEEE